MFSIDAVVICGLFFVSLLFFKRISSHCLLEMVYILNLCFHVTVKTPT